MKRTALVFALCLGTLPLWLCARDAVAAPGMRLQGQLANAAGEPMSGLVGLTIRVYGVASGGTALYSESFSQMITNGALDLIVGAGIGTTTDDIVAALSPQPGETSLARYLAMQIDGDDTELSPRRRVTGGAFASYAFNAATLAGQPANYYASTQQLQSYATTQELSNYVTTQQAQNYITTQQAQNYITTTQAQTFVTNEQVTQALANYVQSNPPAPSPVTFAAAAPVTFAQPQGTAPFAVQSTTVVQNLNCDRIDGVSLEQLARTDLDNLFQRNQVIEGTARFEGANTFVGTTTFTKPQGTAPFAVASSTVVSNLNCDFLDGVSSGSFARLDLPNLYQGAQVFEGSATFEGAVSFAASQGTVPFTVQSSTLVPNLNAELLGGQTASGFARLGNTNTFSTAQSFASGATFAGQATFSSSAAFTGNAAFSGATTFAASPTFASGATFAGAASFNAAPAFNTGTGNAPFSVASTTQVDNLNAAFLNGKTAAQIISDAGGAASCTSCSNALALGGQAPAFYTNATNLSSGTVPNAALPANIARASGAATPFEDGFLAMRATGSVISTTLHGTATAARDITFPDATGTVITTGNLSAITAVTGLTTRITPTQGGLGINSSTVVAGDLLVASGAGQWAILPKSTGSDGQVLKLVSGVPAWGTDNTGGAGTLPITSGGTGATTVVAARNNLLAAGSGANSDITALTGLSTPLAPNQGGIGINSSTIAAGDILYASGAGQWAVLQKASAVDGQVLKLQSGVPAWGTDNTGGGGGGGTITSVATGTGLTITGSPNPIVSSGTISIDTAVIPRLSAANTYTGTQTVVSSAAANVPVTVTGASGQTANLQEWKTNVGGTVASMSAAGAITGASFAGSGAGLTALNATQLTAGTVPDARLSANVTTLAGAQTVSGVKTFLDTTAALRSAATAFATTLHSAATAARDVTFADVTGTVITSGNLTGITATGTIASGTWQGSAIAAAYGGLGQDTSGAARGSVLYKNVAGNWQPLAAGSAGQVLKTGGAGADPTWGADNAGTGTVQSLTQGTGIALSANPIVSSGVISIDTNTVPQLSASNTFTGGQVMQPSTSLGIPLTVKGVVGQAGDLQRWLDGAGATAAAIDANGDVIAASFTGDGAGLSSLNASSLSSGTVPDGRLSSTVATTNTAQSITGAKTFLDAMLVLRNTAGTFSTTVKSVAAANNTVTFPASATGNVITQGNLSDVDTTGLTWQGAVVGGVYGGTGLSVQTPPTGAILYKTGSAGTSAWAAISAPASGQVLKYNGTQWVPTTLASSDVTGVATLAGPNAFVGTNTFSTGTNTFSSTTAFNGTNSFAGTSAFNNNVTMTSLNSASTPLTLNGVANQSQPLINVNGVASQTSALMSLNANATHSGNVLDVKSGASSILAINPASGLALQNFGAAVTPLTITAATSQSQPLVNLNGVASQTSALMSINANTTHSGNIIDIKKGVTSVLTLTSAGALSNLASISGLSALSMAASGTLSVPATGTLSIASGGALTVAGAANLGGATLSGALNAASNIAGGTLTSTTLASSTLSGSLSANVGTSLNATNLSVSGGAFSGGTFNGTFTGNGAGLVGTSAILSYNGIHSPHLTAAQGCQIKLNASNQPAVFCDGGTAPCFSATGTTPGTSSNSGCATLSAACQAYCVDSMTGSSHASKTFDLAKYQFYSSGTYGFSISRSMACYRYSNAGPRTLSIALNFCGDTGCSAPVALLTDPASFSSGSGGTDLIYYDVTYAAISSRTFTYATFNQPRVRFTSTVTMSTPVGTGGGNTLCFFVREDQRATRPQPDSNITTSLLPTGSFDTW